MIDILVDILKDTKEKNPLIHQITNYVTVNDCANVTLAIGASPVMADEIDEVEDFVDIASSLLLNIGTINKRVKKSIKKASSKAKSINTPVILDPVGVGASKIRTSIVKELLKESKVDVLRGNISEIKSILKISSNTKGVDASKDDFD
jgi:hydroxyethylthiazole kinase